MPAAANVSYLFDVGAAQSTAELYATISETLGRPCRAAHYSLAWELDEHPMPVEITVTGIEALRSRLPTQAKLLMLVLKEVATRHAAEGFVLHVV